MTFGNQFSFKLSRGSSPPSDESSEEEKEKEESSLKTIKEEANDNLEEAEKNEEKKKSKKTKSKKKKAKKKESEKNDGITAFSSLKAPSLAHPYSKLLWKINKFKSEEVEKQSMLIQESHNKLCHSNTEGTTRHGFRKNNVKPKIDKQGRPLEFKFVDCIGFNGKSEDGSEKKPKKEGYRRKLREKRKKKREEEKERREERKEEKEKEKERKEKEKEREKDKEEGNPRESDGSSFLTFRSSGASQKTEIGSTKSSQSNFSKVEREEAGSTKGDASTTSTKGEDSHHFSHLMDKKSSIRVTRLFKSRNILKRRHENDASGEPDLGQQLFMPGNDLEAQNRDAVAVVDMRSPSDRISEDSLRKISFESSSSSVSPPSPTALPGKQPKRSVLRQFYLRRGHHGKGVRMLGGSGRKRPGRSTQTRRRRTPTAHSRPLRLLPRRRAFFRPGCCRRPSRRSSRRHRRFRRWARLCTGRGCML